MTEPEPYCMYCPVEMYFLCTNPDEDGNPCGLASDEEIPFKKLGAPVKTGELMRDVLSTGRKRAAEVAPLTEMVPIKCEWSGLKYAGGGVKPIIGCKDNKADARHHGPDKSTLNNEVGVNLHRICVFCHNRWHTLNDIYYGKRPEKGEPFVPQGMDILPHDNQTKATDEEMVDNERYWSARDKSKVGKDNGRGNDDEPLGSGIVSEMPT